MGEVAPVFKVGDHVRKVRGAYAPYNMVVTEIRGDHILGKESKDLPGSVFGHAPAYEYDLIKRPSDTLDDQLTAAKLEVERLVGLIAERDAPKVGDQFKKSNITFTVVYVDIGSKQTAYTYEGGNGWCAFKSWDTYERVR